MPTRLDAFLSHRGFGSRSTVRPLIRHGRVRVDGRVERDPGRHVDGLAVLVNGVPVEDRITEATLILHKPVGHACSHDPREAPLVDELVPAPYQHLSLNLAGRLDRDTSGLLILTTDGQLIHALTNPRRHLAKRYRISYLGTLSAHAVERVAKGILLADDPEPTRPGVLRLEGVGADGRNRATMLLEEGRFHQVRRMIAALGGQVEALHRDRIGDLDLPADLAPGAMRELTAGELAALTCRPAPAGGIPPGGPTTPPSA